MQFELDDYVAPAKAPHAYVPTVQQLIDAGEGKILRATGTKEELEAELRKFQEAARELDVSAKRRNWTDNGDGTWTIGIGVGPKISRPRAEKSEEPPVEETAAPKGKK